MPTRRAFTFGLMAAPFPAFAAETGDARLIAMEQKIGGRLGVHAFNTATGATVLSYRAGERFPMASTFKASLAGFILSRIDAKQETLARAIKYTPLDLLDYAPVTKANVAQGAMSVADLCKAAIELSDNTAANLLLRESGGPAALTAWLAKTGDTVTRLDRTEPTLNEATPDDPRDTTTPAAMAATVQRLLLGPVLTPSSRERLLGWMKGNQTGDARLRAGVAKGWVVADKTGSGAHGSLNDIGLLIPPVGVPIAVAVYTTMTTAKPAEVEAASAEVARIITMRRA